MAFFSCLYKLEFLTKMWTSPNTQSWLGDTLNYSSVLFFSVVVTCSCALNMLPVSEELGKGTAGMFFLNNTALHASSCDACEILFGID